ncbi:O-antigen ligase family protein [Coraliomargarita algicola]|uniref:O-antigen ligase family protein n=1 Tax=Coraliomargarita algicola TaxID=3092156 RepID=A0ABZ0RMC9_9BACT|nr:O-antigen ligase family protein [Coraliomargarita sp. J2-16]WPJ97380.1 O-antigen ligase family protein [Coraliomargarita sp. J2-16]
MLAILVPHAFIVPTIFMLLYNVVILLVLVMANGGRYDWVYEWGALALWMNSVPLCARLVATRCCLLGHGPVFWLLGVWLPWMAFSAFFSYSLFNPNYTTIYNNLFSPLLPLDYQMFFPTTPNPERSRLFLQFLIGLFFMTMYLLVAPLSRRGIRRSLNMILFFGCMLAVIGSLMKLSGTQAFLWIFEFREPCAFATFFYKNHYAYFALICIGIGMGRFSYHYFKECRSAHIPETSIAYALFLSLIFVSIALAEARGAALLALLLLFYFLISLFHRLIAKRRALGLLLAIVLPMLSCFAIYQLSAPQIQRSLQRSEGQLQAIKARDLHHVKRLALYRDTWLMIRDKPFWGWGIGSFIHIHPVYAGAEFYPEGFTYPVAYEFTHSDYLQSLSEMGLIGCCLLFAPFFVLLIGLRKRDILNNRYSRWPLLAVILVAVSACFDFTLSAPAIAMGVLLVGTVAVNYAYNNDHGRLVLDHS